MHVLCFKSELIICSAKHVLLIVRCLCLCCNGNIAVKAAHYHRSKLYVGQPMQTLSILADPYISLEQYAKRMQEPAWNHAAAQSSHGADVPAHIQHNEGDSPKTADYKQRQRERYLANRSAFIPLIIPPRRCASCHVITRACGIV